MHNDLPLLASTRECGSKSFSNWDIGRHVGDCERMISFAAKRGIAISEADLAAAARAFDAYAGGTWNSEVSTPFYVALTHIAQAISPVTAETLSPAARLKATRVLWIYSASALLLAILVIALSCVMLILNQFSDDIDAKTKENDDLALSIHDELQAFVLEVIGSSEGRELASDHFVNSAPALELKKHLQAFAINTRQHSMHCPA
jgi:hypothetical protein